MYLSAILRIVYARVFFKAAPEAVRVEDANGNALVYSYDSSLDRLDYVFLDLDDDGTWDANEPKNTYEYDKDRLDKVTVNGFDYNFTYDGFGNVTDVKVETQSLVSNTYDVRKGLLDDSTYGNGDTVDYVYDDLDRLTQKNFDGGDAEFKYFYNANGLIGYMTDGEAGIEYRYLYDEADRPGRVERSNGITSWYHYDDDLNTATTTENFYESIGGSGDTYETEYNSDEDGRPASVIISADGGTEYKVTYSYDYLNRVNTKQYFTGTSEEYKEEYTFIAGGQGANSETALISSVEYNDTDTLTYTYDDNGNIETLSNGTDTIQYYYDEMNELVRENNPFLGANGKTVIYTYDNFGNIDEKNEYEFAPGTATPTTLLDTIDYTYDATWKDKLASYDGSSITYDTIGNPLTYDGWTYTWKWGRRLETAGNTGAGISTSFKYNDGGIRTYKQVTDGEDVTEYFYNLMGSKITYEERTGAGACTLYYAYDSGGKLYGFYYDGASDDGFYFYKRNVQGDITGILDSNGTEVVTYLYDTWGNPVNVTGSLAATIGEDNPFRYRGYYWDDETGLYYLNARYYNPSWGRFINADSFAGRAGQLLSHNLFAYCSNNPVMNSDTNGHDWWSDFWSDVGFILTAVWESIEIDAGIGYGVGFQAGSVTAWTKTDVLGIRVDDGQFSVVRHAENKIEGGTAYAQYGANTSLYDYYTIDKGFPDARDGYDVLEETKVDRYVIGGGAGIYTGVGGSFSVGINLEELYYKLKNHFGWKTTM